MDVIFKIGMQKENYVTPQTFTKTKKGTPKNKKKPLLSLQLRIYKKEGNFHQ
jgi:hypothetical protein